MLIKTSLSITLKHFTNKHNFNFFSFEIITIYNTQLDHIRKLIGQITNPNILHLNYQIMLQILVFQIVKYNIIIK